MVEAGQSPLKYPYYRPPRPKINLEFKYTFALSLFQKLCQEKKKSFVFSPLSLASCFAMTTVGLRGEAKTELLEFLRAPDEEFLHKTFAALLNDKEQPQKTSNKFLAANDFEVRDEAMHLLKVDLLSEKLDVSTN